MLAKLMTRLWNARARHLIVEIELGTCLELGGFQTAYDVPNEQPPGGGSMLEGTFFSRHSNTTIH